MARYFDAGPARERLRAAADACGLTVAELAGVIGIPLRTLSRILTERTTVRWDTADRIAIALGSHPCELWPHWFAPERTGTDKT